MTVAVINVHFEGREPGRTPFNNPKTAKKNEGTPILTFYAVLESSRRAATDGTGPLVWQCLVPEIFQFENMKSVWGMGAKHPWSVKNPSKHNGKGPLNASKCAHE